MTIKNAKTIIAVIPVLLVLVVALNVQEADAAKCTGVDERCYAKNYHWDSNTKGLKYTTTVTNMVPVSSCSDMPVATGWVIFPNRDWVEVGFSSGWLQSTCNTSEFAYYAYKDLFGYHEVKSSALSIGSTHTFSMDDINQDKYWLLQRGTSSLANVLMAYEIGDQMQVGIEGNKDNPPSTWIPETQFRNTAIYGTSWITPTTVGVAEDNLKGYYHDPCIANFKDFNAGTLSGVNC